MGNKIDEVKMMDYLYGEMSADELLEFEKLLGEDAQLRAKVEELSAVQGVLGSVEAQDVVIPSFALADKAMDLQRGWLNHSSFKWSLSVAASILILLTTAYWMEFKVVQNQGQLYIGFGQSIDSAPAISAQQVQQMIDEAVTQQKISTQTELGLLASSMDEKLNENHKKNQNALKQGLLNHKIKTDEVLKLYVAQLNEGNKKMIENFFVVSNKTQKEYMNTVLADFNEFYQNQRNYDMEMIQSNLGMMQDNYSVRQLEQENLLANLYDIVKTQSK
ncbi:hypothetical protein N6H18_13915 [Reichenbachiella agarivorans]|uniref:Anti-sigma factor n=1 Tax=Reichenbachiella agarivorans TaxID=2979464 RepID=A0ABY6CLQ8_9BACT|nr:hypothetical protein [Reichenbachiella agarivorans]UXP31447.1 hypothetical protein N6H18_13915 [Reichenbachiella agarivorans]